TRVCSLPHPPGPTVFPYTTLFRSAADKGYKRLMNAIALSDKIQPSPKKATLDLQGIRERSYAAMDDDFNSPVLIAELFEVVRYINAAYDGKAPMDNQTLTDLKDYLKIFVQDILGLQDDTVSAGSDNMDELLQIIINIRNEAKKNKDFTTSDRIREELAAVGIQLKDSKDGTLWNKI